MLSRYLETASGDTLSFRIVLRDGSSPVDVSTATFTGGVRVPGSRVNLLDFNFEITGGPIGVVRVYLTPEQTATLRNSTNIYEWHVRLVNGDYVKTLGYGALKVVTL